MSKRIEIIESIMSANDQLAQSNREELDTNKVFSLNFMASPGAGKTSLIEITIERLIGEYNIAVIDGDIATDIDADRAASAGAVAVQINTGGECHLDAVMVQEALSKLNLSEFDLLIVENVGNLICPANFKLGTHKNVLISSIPEGDDKPYKYPNMFLDVDALVINKIDLLPYVPFDMENFQQGVTILNPGIESFHLSCTSKEGTDLWVNWIGKEIEYQRKA